MKDPKRVAAGKKSKRKGSGFELKLAKQFKEWWGTGQFARSPGSGGWGRPQHREGFNASGDIITTNRDFPWCVEAKHQEGWSLDQLLLNDKCTIHSWWEQCKDETPESLEPLLVFKKNRQQPMAMVHKNWWSMERKSLKFMLPDRRQFIASDRDGCVVLVFMFNDLLNVNPDTLRKNECNE